MPETPPQDTSAFEVVALKTRTAPVQHAIDEARRALAWLRKAGATRCFWKYCSTFDSTPKGNIGPVAEALMDDLDTEQTIYCPAFPENGRSVFMGNLFVGQQPLSESSMKDHPLTPMRDSNLMRLLEPQVSRPVGLTDRLVVAQGVKALQASLAQHKSASIAHVVVDALANADLETIAAACRDMPLITGGSALAMPLPDLYLADGLLSEDALKQQVYSIDRKTIVLSGSCSAMTNAQVAAYIATGAPSYRLDPLMLSQTGPNALLGWLARQNLADAPLIYATADPSKVKAAQAKLGVAKVGALIEDTLAVCAVAARDAGAQRIIVAGGETSGAVTKALDIDQLDIAAEITPGVPWCFCISQGARIALALKSGNFGGEDFFTLAQTKLDSP